MKYVSDNMKTLRRELNASLLEFATLMRDCTEEEKGTLRYALVRQVNEQTRELIGVIDKGVESEGSA